MKKFSVSLLVALLGVAMLPSVTSADDLSSQQSAISAVTKAQCDAIVADDTDSWAKTMTPDFTSINPDGSVDTLDASVAHLKEALSAIAFSSCAFNITAIKQSGSGFVVNVTAEIDGKMVSNSAPASVTETAVDTWTDASGAWLQKGDFVVEQKVTIDGKVVQDQTNSGTPPR